MSKRRSNKTVLRQQGNKPDKGPKKRIINFNLSKIIPDQGQTLDQWNEEDLLIKLNVRIKQIGSMSREEVLHQKIIKEYPGKVGFPLDSNFNKPTYLNPDRWAVMHLTNNSKEVVAGFLKNDVFYVVFLDKEHDFWPTDLQNRGKTRR